MCPRFQTLCLIDRTWLSVLSSIYYYKFTTKVRSNQEDRLKPYFAELEVNIKVLSFRTCW